MIYRILIVFLFTLVIHFIATLAYSVRLVGVKTGRIAVSFALFNILVLVSRTANSFQAPLLAKVIEHDLPGAGLAHPRYIFNVLILAASIGTAAGAFLIPTFQGLLAKLVERFSAKRSLPRLIMHSFTKTGVRQIRDNFKIPSRGNVQHFKDLKHVPVKLIILNALIVAVLTVGSYAALYAALRNPNLRLTSITLVPIITGIATVLLVVCVDPFFSLLTDDCLEGKASQAFFSKCVVLMVASRFVGTLVAQLLLIPASGVILFVARMV